MEEISDLNSFLPHAWDCDYLLEDCATSGMQVVAEELDYELV